MHVRNYHEWQNPLHSNDCQYHCHHHEFLTLPHGYHQQNAQKTFSSQSET